MPQSATAEFTTAMAVQSTNLGILQPGLHDPGRTRGHLERRQIDVLPETRPKKKKHRIYVLPCRGMAFIRRVTGQCLFPPMPAILFHTSLSSEKPAGISTVVVQQPFCGAESPSQTNSTALVEMRIKDLNTCNKRKTPKRPAVKAKKCKLKYYSVPTEDRVLVHTNCMRTLTTRSSP